MSRTSLYQLSYIVNYKRVLGNPPRLPIGSRFAPEVDFRPVGAILL